MGLVYDLCILFALVNLNTTFLHNYGNEDKQSHAHEEYLKWCNRAFFFCCHSRTDWEGKYSPSVAHAHHSHKIPYICVAIKFQLR